MWRIAREVDDFKKESTHVDYDLNLKGTFIKKVLEFSPLKSMRSRNSILKKIKKSRVIRKKVVDIQGQQVESNSQSRKFLIQQKVDEIGEN